VALDVDQLLQLVELAVHLKDGHLDKELKGGQNFRPTPKEALEQELVCFSQFGPIGLQLQASSIREHAQRSFTELIGRPAHSTSVIFVSQDLLGLSQSLVLQCSHCFCHQLSLCPSERLHFLARAHSNPAMELLQRRLLPCCDQSHDSHLPLQLLSGVVFGGKEQRGLQMQALLLFGLFQINNQDSFTA
jgi:hypothetical protein